MKFHSKYQAGASLMEVLITLLIVGIGLLGVAALQGNSVRYLRIANQRSEAVQIAYDISDRMRSNANGLAGYSYTGGAVPSQDCLTDCSPSLLAKRDMYEWITDLSTRLNGGRAVIVPALVNTQTVYDVTVIWLEAGLSGIDSNCPASANPASGERCFGLRIVP